MNANLSEKMFATFLDGMGMEYQQHFSVNGERNVDFLVNINPPLYCDVKEVRPSAKPGREVDAYAHLRDDLKDLRRKFGSSRPTIPVLLVTINFSGRLFTGFSVARAMLGDVGAEFSVEGRSPFHHLPRGSASMTASHHTVISAILVFDSESPRGNALFPNPFAAHPVPDHCFPQVRRVIVDRSASEEHFRSLAQITFWPCDEPAL